MMQIAMLITVTINQSLQNIVLLALANSHVYQPITNLEVLVYLVQVVEQEHIE